MTKTWPNLMFGFGFLGVWAEKWIMVGTHYIIICPSMYFHGIKCLYLINILYWLYEFQMSDSLYRKIRIFYLIVLVKGSRCIKNSMSCGVLDVLDVQILVSCVLISKHKKDTMSWTCPGRVQDVSRTCPGHVLDGVFFNIFSTRTQRTCETKAAV